MFLLDILYVTYLLPIYYLSTTYQVLPPIYFYLSTYILIICLFYLACVAPRIVYYIIAFTGGFDSVTVGDFQHYLDYALNFLYWWHYTANFAIYAARSEQYRQAYIYFINEVGTLLTYHMYITKEFFFIYYIIY